MDEGERHRRGGADVRGRGLLVDAAAVGGCNKRGGGGGWGSNAEAEMVCLTLYCMILYDTLLGKASKIWEVGRKSVGSSWEVARKFCANYYPTCSN